MRCCFRPTGWPLTRLPDDCMWPPIRSGPGVGDSGGGPCGRQEPHPLTPPGDTRGSVPRADRCDGAVKGRAHPVWLQRGDRYRRRTAPSPGEHAGENGDECPITWLERRTSNLAPKNRDLVPEHGGPRSPARRRQSARDGRAAACERRRDRERREPCASFANAHRSPAHPGSRPGPFFAALPNAHRALTSQLPLARTEQTGV